MPAIRTAEPETSGYTFFWSTDHVNGWASQWYAAPLAQVNIDGNEETIHFPSNEHWMMLASHAGLQLNVVEKVRAIKGTSKSELSAVKKLGRQVKNFDDVIWVKHRERIVTEGSVHKFRQNGELRAKLFATGDTCLVEASPRDRIWGIGCSEANALSGKGEKKWGMNLLGKALVNARAILREEEQVKDERERDPPPETA
ncbi:unnamed protein product [Mycena citricolor]|uniref:NADAR domain-containing protein n=1 Tax=Mycena citricolor TaxID=2018698 RepID=A0AAD2K229_9AGAR|nr:unnamed protein product [Mycena citricolor]